MLQRRARSFLGSPRYPLWAALTLSALAVVAIGSPALVGAATGVGARLELGKFNSVNASTSLTATTTGAAFALKNLGTGGGLNITVKAGKPPINVSAGAGKATNLDADKLDGKDGSEYEPRIDHIRDLNGVSCSDGDQRALIYVLRPNGPLLECIYDAHEPNDTVDQAVSLPPTALEKSVVGATDVDWYVLTDRCTDEVQRVFFSGQVWGDGVTLDLYIDGAKWSSGPGFHHGSPCSIDPQPTFTLRISGPSLTPYAIEWDGHD